jgi:hypothetical protein
VTMADEGFGEIARLTGSPLSGGAGYVRETLATPGAETRQARSDLEAVRTEIKLRGVFSRSVRTKRR